MEAAEQFSEDSFVVMGLRHLDASPQGRFFTGSIRDARIYAVALTAEQISALKPGEATEPAPLDEYVQDSPPDDFAQEPETEFGYRGLGVYDRAD